MKTKPDLMTVFDDLTDSGPAQSLLVHLCFRFLCAALLAATAFLAPFLFIVFQHCIIKLCGRDSESLIAIFGQANDGCVGASCPPPCPSSGRRRGRLGSDSVAFLARSEVVLSLLLGHDSCTAMVAVCRPIETWPWLICSDAQLPVDEPL